MQNKIDEDIAIDAVMNVLEMGHDMLFLAAK
jgi:hypothetical protein